MPMRNMSRRFAVTAMALVICVAGTTSAPGQFQNLLGGGLQGGIASKSKAEVSFSLEPADAKPGDEVTFRVSVSLPEGSYTYSTDPSFGGHTRIEVTEAAELQPIDKEFRADHPPKVANDEFLGRVEKYEKSVTWSKTYRIEPGAAAQNVALRGVLNYQVCDAATCRPLKTPFEVRLNAASAESAAAPFTFEETRDYKGEPGPATLRVELSPNDAGPGDKVTLSVSLRMDEHWHTYSTTQKPGNAAVATSIKASTVQGLKPLGEGFQPDRKPEIKRPLEDIEQEVYDGEVTWTQQFEVTAEKYGAAGEVRYQVCDKARCLQPETVAFAVGRVEAGQAVALPAAAGNVAPMQLGGADNPEVAAAEVAGHNENDPTRAGLIPFLVAAATAGFLALLTPCVFPMVPITVSFFLKQSETEHHRPLFMALVYCAGIMVTFTILGLLMAVFFGAASLTTLANNPWLNLAIAAVLIFFGMNLLGMFELRVPSWLLTWSSGKEGQGGIIGVLFMAFTFTLVSFTCTFAFVGFLLVLAANGQYYWPILGMLAFSAAFSLPFFFLALFPSLLKALPKSGGWMNTVKVTMGLIEVGAAFKFLSVADLAWNPMPMVFDYALVMSAWIIISICAGLYLLGVFRLPHDTPSESISVVRLVAAMGFLGLAGYLSVGVFAAEKPEGKVWENIVAFAPPKIEGGQGDIGPYIEHDGLKYALDVNRAVQFASQKNLPLFFDFTGVNCTNCRKMEKRMEQPHLRKRLENFVLVRLYTDNVPTIQDRERSQELLETNIKRQVEWFGDTTLPAYAVVTPDGEDRLATFIGLEQQEGAFAEFLDKGLEKWRLRKNGGAPEGQLVSR